MPFDWYWFCPEWVNGWKVTTDRRQSAPIGRTTFNRANRRHFCRIKWYVKIDTDCQRCYIHLFKNEFLKIFFEFLSFFEKQQILFPGPEKDEFFHSLLLGTILVPIEIS